MFFWAMFGVVGADSLNCFYSFFKKMDSKIGFEMSLIVVEAIRGRCEGFMILTSTVSEIFGGQTNTSMLVVQHYRQWLSDSVCCYWRQWV